MADDGSITLAQRLAGALWGHLVGDAMGVPYEFRPATPADRVEFGAQGTWNQPPGTWSDDGSLMLATLDSLLSAGPGGTPGFDPQDMGARYVAWMRDGAYTPDGDGRFDIGRTTATALLRIAAGTPATEAGEDHERSKANGSLMRILPLALVDRDIDDDELVRRTEVASAITHANLVPMVTCALYVLVARRLLVGERARANVLADERTRLEDRYAGEPGRREAFGELLAWPNRQGRGGACDGFWTAWDAFAGADSYEATIRRAIAYGNDTDTTACIAGGLAGIYWGLEGIPAGWRSAMRDQAQITAAADRLLDRELGGPPA